MGIVDYIWPFQKKFSEIPCARESALAGLMGGTCAGALVIILKSKPLLAYKITVFAGVGICWVTFGYCRYDYAKQQKMAEQFQEAQRAGIID